MKMKKLKKVSLASSIFMAIIAVILIIYAISLLTAMFWAFFQSLKTYGQFRKDPLGLPDGMIWDWGWDNYSLAFQYFYIIIGWKGGQKIVYLEELFLNSFIYSFTGALLCAFVPMFAAYLAVIYKNWLSKLATTVVIVTMVLPIYGGGGAMIVLLQRMGLYDNRFGYIFWTTTSFTGMNYLIWLSMFKASVKEYSEAAKVDGAGEMRIMFQIQFPLVIKMYMTFALLSFIGRWGDYMTPLLHLPSYPTVAYGLFEYCGSLATATSSVPMRLAGCMLMLLPLLILFICFHKRLIGNIAFGGLKG